MFFKFLNDNGDPREPKTFIVNLPSYNLSNTNDSYTYGVIEVIFHDRYDDYSVDFDIALLRLDTDGLDIGPKSEIRTVCLPIKGTGNEMI